MVPMFRQTIAVKKRKRSILGPGSYTPKVEISRFGNYMPSHYQNTNSIRFGLPSNNKRCSKLRKVDGPGPGSYLLPGDFGLYKSSSRKKIF